MENKNALNYWTKVASNIFEPVAVKVNPINDFTDYDVKFIIKFSNSNSKILDLASGTGMIINKLASHVNYIVAVEAYKEFSKFIDEVDNINVINEDIMKFSTNEMFDLITMFGIVQYFNEEEVRNLYIKYSKNLKLGGMFIIKNQFGVHKDVIVNGYSKELKTNYFSNYRHIDKEVNILKNLGFKNIEVIDIYPPECNRWSNTHFYAIISEK